MDGQLHRDNIRSELGGFFNTGHAEGTITNGHLRLRRGRASAASSHDWLEPRRQLPEVDLRRVQHGEVDGPGLEFASEGHAKAANQSGNAYRAHIDTAFQYCVDQAQKCQNALDDYLGVEHHNVIEIRNAGPQAGI